MLPCELNIIVGKQAINDKLQGSVATYLSYGGIVNNHIKKGFCWACQWILFNPVNIWQSYNQEDGCLMHFLRHLAMRWPSAQSAWDNHLLACNFAKY